MARRSAAHEQPEEFTLYDIDPRFQEALAKWLSKKPHGIVVDIGPNRQNAGGRFWITFDPGGEVFADSFELALVDAMGMRARTRHIDPELEVRVHEFLAAHDAHMTFGASNGVFNVIIGGPNAQGQASDEDLELALVFAEEDYWEHMPRRPLPPEKREALAQALLQPRAQREEEAHEQLHRALFDPRPELEANRRERYSVWVADVSDQLEAMGATLDDAGAEYWRQLYQAGFGPSEAVVEFGRSFRETHGFAPNMHPHRVVHRWQRPFTYGTVPPTPPSMRESEPPQRVEYGHPDDRPFDPEAPREQYAGAHHFAVNRGGYFVTLEQRLGGQAKGWYPSAGKGDFQTPEAGEAWAREFTAQLDADSRYKGPSRWRWRVEPDAGHSERQARYALNGGLEANARWTRAYINSLPDSAFLYVEGGGSKDGHGRSHPLSLRHLPYKDRSGRIDQAHLHAALTRVHQESTRLPKSVKDAVYRDAQAIYQREFGYAHEMAANTGDPSFQPMPGTRRFKVTRRSRAQDETGRWVDVDALIGPRGYGFMSLVEARRWAEDNRVGPYSIAEYVAGSDEDPRMRTHG